MNNIEKQQEEIILYVHEIEKLSKEIQDLANKVSDLESKKSSLHGDLYIAQLRLAHIQEIYRLATSQFSRLKKYPKAELQEEDVQELDKWIGRAKSTDGLVDIVEALKELDKYKPFQVKNVFALVQKIIIGGAWKKPR